MTSSIQPAAQYDPLAIRTMGAIHPRGLMGCTHPTVDRSVVGGVARQQKRLRLKAGETSQGNSAAIRRMGETHRRGLIGCTPPTADCRVIGVGQQQPLAQLARPAFSLQRPAAFQP